MATYNTNNFWLDKSDDDMPRKMKVKRTIDLSTIASEFDGLTVIRSIPVKEYKPSPETHKDKKERIETPYIEVMRKPSKRANKRKIGGYYTMLDNSPSVTGDIKTESVSHTVLAGNERGERTKYPYRKQ